VGDAVRSITLIFSCGVALTLVQALVWSALIEYFSTIMVQLTAVIAIVMPTFLTLWLYHKSGVLDGSYMELRKQANAYDGAYSDKLHSSLSPDPGSSTADPAAAMSEDETKLYLYCAIGCTLITLFLFFIVITNAKGLRQAAGVITEASKALRTMPDAFLWPLFPVALQTGIVMYWAVVVVYLSTSNADDIAQSDGFGLAAKYSSLRGMANESLSVLGDNFYLPGTPISMPKFNFSVADSLAENSTGAVYFDAVSVGFSSFNTSSFNFSPPNITVTSGNVMTAVYWYHGFGLLWTLALIEGIWYCGLSGAISHWYWDVHSGADLKGGHHKDRRWKEKKVFVIPHTVYKAVRYHAGSIARGAAMIAFVQLLQVIFEVFIRKAKMVTKHKRLAGIRNAINAMRATLIIWQAAAAAVSSSAYIMVVMTGHHFADAGKVSSSLAWRHTTTVVFIDAMANMVLRLAKVCMIAVSTLTMFLALETDAALPTLGLIGVQQPRITSPTFPLFLVALLSYIVSTAYTDVSTISYTSSVVP
jgi:hypothetical protein